MHRLQGEPTRDTICITTTASFSSLHGLLTGQRSWAIIDPCPIVNSGGRSKLESWLCWDLSGTFSLRHRRVPRRVAGGTRLLCTRELYELPGSVWRAHLRARPEDWQEGLARLRAKIEEEETEYQYTAVRSWRIARSGRNAVDLAIHSEPLRSTESTSPQPRITNPRTCREAWPERSEGTAEATPPEPRIPDDCFSEKDPDVITVIQ
jgi:hypothetical protein